MKRLTYKFKIMKTAFDTVVSGSKVIVLKTLNVPISVGDRLELLEYSVKFEGIDISKEPSGRRCFRTIKYIHRTFPGIERGYSLIEIK